MKETKDPRGRKPVKDKKQCIRLYIRESKIKQFGGDKKLLDRLYSIIEKETSKL